MGTGQAVFQDRVHVLTALRLWSCTFTAALDKTEALDGYHSRYKLREKLAWTEDQFETLQGVSVR